MAFWKSPTEKEIENSILDWLNYQSGILAFKVNTIGIYDAAKGAYRRPGRHVIKGCADIIATVSIQGFPIFVSLEVKSSKGVQSPDQKDFERRVKGVHSFYYVVRSIEDTQKALTSIRSRILSQLFDF